MPKLHKELFKLKIASYKKAIIRYKKNEIFTVDFDNYDLMAFYPKCTFGYAMLNSKVTDIQSETAAVAYIDIRPSLIHRKMFKTFSEFKERVESKK